MKIFKILLTILLIVLSAVAVVFSIANVNRYYILPLLTAKVENGRVIVNNVCYKNDIFNERKLLNIKQYTEGIFTPSMIAFFSVMILLYFLLIWRTSMLCEVDKATKKEYSKINKHYKFENYVTLFLGLIFMVNVYNYGFLTIQYFEKLNTNKSEIVEKFIKDNQINKLPVVEGSLNIEVQMRELYSIFFGMFLLLIYTFFSMYVLSEEFKKSKLNILKLNILKL